MNQLEAEFSKTLLWMKSEGVIDSYSFEPERFELCPFNLTSNTTASYYTPDFIALKDGKKLIYEVKGKTKEKLKKACSVRLRFACWRYPEHEWYYVTRKRNGSWSIKRIGAGL